MYRPHFAAPESEGSTAGDTDALQLDSTNQGIKAVASAAGEFVVFLLRGRTPQLLFVSQNVSVRRHLR